VVGYWFDSSPTCFNVAINVVFQDATVFKYDTNRDCLMSCIANHSFFTATGERTDRVVNIASEILKMTKKTYKENHNTNGVR